MADPSIQGLTARQQAEFLKRLADRVHANATRMGLAEVIGNEKLRRQLIAEIVEDSRQLADYEDLLTERGGYLELQSIIEQRKRLPAGGRPKK